jgi:hypothetical protein
MIESFFWWLDQLDPTTRGVSAVAVLVVISALAGCVFAFINEGLILTMLLLYGLLLLLIDEPIKAQAWLANGLHQQTTIRNVSIGAAIAEMVVLIGLAVPA